MLISIINGSRLQQYDGPAAAVATANVLASGGVTAVGDVVSVSPAADPPQSDAEAAGDITVTDWTSGALQAVQFDAAKRLLDFDGEVFPADGCAITLSVLLQDAGIDVPDTFQALALGNVLRKRGWQEIKLGEQASGDVGSTCGSVAQHGMDHIYFVIKVLNPDEMVIIDNQQSLPHFRFASGKGKTPTKVFLRPPG